jgi:surfeit locus 1 family protein
MHRGRLWSPDPHRERRVVVVNARAGSLAASDVGSRRRGLVILLATLAGIALATRLGIWQLGRADQKIALQSSLVARAREPVLDAAALARTPAAAEAQQQRSVVLHGRWIAERTVFLDNRQMDGKVGFFVVTPLALDPGPGAVLVQRGWLPRSFTDRSALPKFETPTAIVTVPGTVAPSPARLFEFGGAASGPIRQNLDIAAFARETGLDLLPLSVVQHEIPGAAADGLVRHWPSPAVGVQKHYGYAFQWFAIAAAIAFLYVWHRFIRPGKS